VLQAVGGGQAAANADTSAPTDSATSIMVAGIIFQLITMVVFVGLGLDFVIRTQVDRPYAFQQRRVAMLATTERNGKGLGMVEPGERAMGSISAGTMSSVEKGVGSRHEDDGKQGNHAKWWIVLAAAGVSSAMILLRGECFPV
jgi:hypothetical protein